MALPPKVSLALVAACSLAVMPRGAAAQHITIDGRFSPAQTLVGPSYSITANLGKQVGSNLFHSFGQFGLSTGESATFSGPATISNVIGRVTGGNPSSINGTIQSNIAGANLYLINPSGIVFGPNATVNVSGSFHASTADYLKMSDGAKFQATNPDGSTLSAAPPAAFGFLTVQPAAITVNGSTLGPVPGTLGLVGGPVSMTGANLSAPAGTIHVTSAAGTGEVPVDPRNTPALTVTSFGPVGIKGGSTLNVSDSVNLGSGGSVFIRAGALTIDASEINGDNYGSGPGGVLSLRGDSQLTLTNSTNVHSVAYGGGSAANVVISTSPAGIVLADNSLVQTGTLAAGGGSITITAGQLTLQNSANVLAESNGASTGGAVSASVAGALTVTSGASLGTLAVADGTGGSIAIATGQLTIQGGGNIFSTSEGNGAGGQIAITAGSALIDGSAFESSPTGIVSIAEGAGKAGDVAVAAGALSILTNGAIGSATLFAPGDAGSVSVNVAGALMIDGPNANPNLYIGTGISSLAQGSKGNAGQVQVEAGSLAIANGGVISASTVSYVFESAAGNAGTITVNVAGALSLSNGEISSDTSGSGKGGNVSVTAGALSIVNSGTIGSNAEAGSSGDAGNVTVSAGTLTIVDGLISSGALAASNGLQASTGNAGNVTVNVTGVLSIDGSGSKFLRGIATDANLGTIGNAGNVTVTAGALSIKNNGEIGSGTFGSGNGGSIFVNVAGQLTIDATSATELTGIAAQANLGSTGNGGSVTVAAGNLSVVNGGVISSDTFGPGKGGSVTVAAGNLSVLNGGEISSDSEAGSRGNAGDVTVNAGTLTIVDGLISSGALAASNVAPTSAGEAGNVTVKVTGLLSIDGSGLASLSGIATDVNPGTIGNAGNVAVTAGALSIINNGEIGSGTFGSGNGGSVSVNVAGQLTIDAGGASGGGLTGVAAQANPGSTGNAGNVTVTAGAVSLLNGATISSSAIGAQSGLVASAGNAGNVNVGVTGLLSIDSGSAIATETDPGTVGRAGQVSVGAGSLTITNGGLISATTSGLGVGGDVTVNVAGDLAINDIASPTVVTGITARTNDPNGGNAGRIVLTADNVSVLNRGLISTSTSGSGNAGEVSVTAFGNLLIDGAGTPGFVTGIASSANAGTGNAGSVAVAAGSISISAGGEIQTLTSTSGTGGNVTVSALGDVLINGSGVGPQITARSTGSGDAGSIILSANRLLMNNGAAISTAAETSTANGGNITLKVRDLLYLVSSDISTSVKGETGNGGNIAIDPQLVILDHSSITAQAIEGHGGNITIAADQFIQSSDSTVSATSQIGISGTVEILGPRVDVNGALVVLSSQLQGRTEVLREACAARADRPISALVEAGRGGLPQDPEATLPALYIAGRDIDSRPRAAASSRPAEAQQTTVHLTLHCGDG